MLLYSACLDINNSSTLDKILSLKADGKFIHYLLSLDEIPDAFEVELGKFILEKQPIVSGFLVDTHENHGLPTLHRALHSAFSKASSGLITIGAVCSAVFKKNDLYVFFDSYSHGKNGFSSSDGASILIAFSCMDDLIAYLYAFYDSLRIDMSLQFDFLPVVVRMFEQGNSHNGQLECHLEAYFEDQKKRQAKKAESIVSDIGIVKQTTSVMKRKKRTKYSKLYKKRQRQDTAFKANEIGYMQNKRKDPASKANEIDKKRAYMQFKRKDPAFKANKIVNERAYIKNKRKDLLLKQTRL